MRTRGHERAFVCDRRTRRQEHARAQGQENKGVQEDTRTIEDEKRTEGKLTDRVGQESERGL